MLPKAWVNLLAYPGLGRRFLQNPEAQEIDADQV
jgi:hypothetical protein